MNTQTFLKGYLNIRQGTTIFPSGASDQKGRPKILHEEQFNRFKYISQW